MLRVAISMRRRLPTRLLLALLGAVVFGRMPLRAATVASSADASITHDESAGTWTLTAGGTSLQLALDAGRDFSIVSLTTGSGVTWTSGAAPDTFVRTGNQSLPFGSRAAGFGFQNVSVETDGDRLQLNATFELASAGLRMTRHYAIVAGSPAFEETSRTSTSPPCPPCPPWWRVSFSQPRFQVLSTGYTVFPPTTVRLTLMFMISFGGTTCGSFSRNTKSASFPAVIDPFRFSSDEA